MVLKSLLEGRRHREMVWLCVVLELLQGTLYSLMGGGIRSALMGNLSLIRAEGRLALGSSLQLAALTKEYSSASAACRLLSG